ncbi:MAG: hypothetical protein LKE59_02495 [Eubacterium sp.]|jgi:hypothetical protein|nr:hypothetical protein [Eubacterium sp.]
MSDSIYEQIGRDAFYLKLDLSAEHIAKLSMNESLVGMSISRRSQIFSPICGSRKSRKRFRRF